MVGRLLTLVALIASLVAFIAEVTGTVDWWVYSLNRCSYVLVVLAVVASLLAARDGNLIVVVVLVLTAAAALAFAIVGLVKYYQLPPPYFAEPGAQSPSTWLGEAQLFSIGVLAFGLTLTRRRSAGLAAWLAAAAVWALGTGIYAFTREASLAGEVWWEVATVGAFLAGAAAAMLERGGVPGGSRAPVPSSPGGDAGSNPVVE
jgi:hypothetical protein